MKVNTKSIKKLFSQILVRCKDPEVIALMSRINEHARECVAWVDYEEWDEMRYNLRKLSVYVGIDITEKDIFIFED